MKHNKILSSRFLAIVTCLASYFFAPAESALAQFCKAGPPATVCCLTPKSPQAIFMNNFQCCTSSGTEVDASKCSPGGILPGPGQCKQVASCWKSEYGNVLSSDSCPPRFDYFVGGKNLIKNVCGRDNDDPNFKRCAPASMDKCL